MRHRKASLKLNRTSSHRDAMFRNMATSLFKYKRIRTTNAKAKELSKWADHLITLAKKGDLHSRRQALSIIREKSVVHKLFKEANEQYGERPGGHTRIIKIGHRAGDAAPLSFIELIGKTMEVEKKPKKKKPQVTKKEDVIEAEEKKTAKEKEPTAKTKKAADPEKKKAGKKKVAAKKAVTKKKETKASAEEKKEKKEKKTAVKKKEVKAKKKAAPKK